jgi:hypothetical protein
MSPLNGATMRSDGSKQRKRRKVEPMSKWKAWLIIAALTGLTGLLLWFGLVIVVRSERMPEGRVDVTVQRRFLGFLPISSETFRDVVTADVYNVAGRGSSGGRRGGTVALQLTSRDGAVSRRTRFGPAFGTQPNDIAQQIQQLIDDRARPAFTRWWMPWVVNIGAIPFVLIVGAFYGELLLRALGFIKPE